LGTRYLHARRRSRASIANDRGEAPGAQGDAAANREPEAGIIIDRDNTHQRRLAGFFGSPLLKSLIVLEEPPMANDPFPFASLEQSLMEGEA
jgi:hypothetical protein